MLRARRSSHVVAAAAAAAVWVVSAILLVVVVRGGEGVDAKCQTIGPPPLVFTAPADLSLHDTIATEWWWYVGNLFVTGSGPHAGEHFGFQVAPVKLDPLLGCESLDVVVVNTDLALSDTARNRYRWVNTYEWGAEVMQTVSAQNVTQRMIGAMWSVVQDPERPDVFYVKANATNAGAAVNTSTPSPDGSPPWRWSLDLVMVQGEPGIAPIAHGGWELDGQTPVAHLDQPYFTITGTVTRSAEEQEDEPLPVEGTAWNQHMWFTGGTSDPSDQLWWDWNFIHLDNGIRCAFQHFRNESDGSYFAPQSYGNCFHLPPPYAPDPVVLSGDDFTESRSHPWHSTWSGNTYDLHVRIRVPGLHGLDVVLTPWIADNELGASLVSFPYYEGTARVVGTFAGQKVSGTGMIESVFPFANHTAAAAAGVAATAGGMVMPPRRALPRLHRNRRQLHHH